LKAGGAELSFRLFLPRRWNLRRPIAQSASERRKSQTHSSFLSALRKRRRSCNPLAQTVRTAGAKGQVWLCRSQQRSALEPRGRTAGSAAGAEFLQWFVSRSRVSPDCGTEPACGAKAESEPASGPCNPIRPSKKDPIVSKFQTTLHSTRHPSLQTTTAILPPEPSGARRTTRKSADGACRSCVLDRPAETPPDEPWLSSALP